MCTVTIVPKPGSEGAFRMACSRDELHGRAPAHPPERRSLANTQALMPIDPASNGTWVGVNEHGLAMTLLNYNPADPPTDRDQSRGGVIPALLHARTVQEVLPLAEPIQADRMMPFRLVACDGQAVMVWRSTDPVREVQATVWDGEPMMWTSSGLGDHLVEGPRRELFEDWFGEDPIESFDKQAGFHRHHWPGREHLSVCMHREDARTVSYTVVDVEPNDATMRYYPDGPDQAVPPILQTLKRRLVQR